MLPPISHTGRSPAMTGRPISSASTSGSPNPSARLGNRSARAVRRCCASSASVHRASSITWLRSFEIVVEQVEHRLGFPAALADDQQSRRCDTEAIDQP